MRVLHIIDSGGMYGAEAMLLNLVAEQIRQGLTPLIASIGNKGCGEKAFEGEARKRNLPIVTFRMLPGPNFLGGLKILRYAKFVKCDLLHCHGYKGRILFGYIPKIISYLPLITTFHGWTSSGNTFSRMRLYEWLDSLALPRMDAVVLVNKGMLTHPKFVGRKIDNFQIIDNGISLEEPTPYFSHKLHLRSTEGKTIVAVGRLSPEKGFDLLLKAFAHIVKDGSNASLVIIGEGDERQKLENMIVQLGLHERVMLPGFVANVATTFSYFDILVMPSLSEGLPITLLEAMRAKLPIIATRVGGIPQVLGEDGGLLVEPGVVAELAGAMSKLVDSQSQRKQFANKALKIFKQKYSAAKMADSYQKVYLDIIA